MSNCLCCRWLASCWLALCGLLLGATGGWATEPVRLVEDPQVSPDGAQILFAHRGDIWQVSSRGGQARRLTFHPADDSMPRWSPDGQSVAFVSERTGSKQVFILDRDQSSPRQVTWHTEGYALQGWFPDGRHLLVTGSRDHGWKYAQRPFKIDTRQRTAEQLIFNEVVNEAQCSPDGKQLLFSMGGERWWRKGYRGSRASQIWLYDLRKEKFTELLKQETESLSPLWKPDGNGIYYCGSDAESAGARNLWEYDLQSGTTRQVTHFEDDLVRQPSISADGQTLVFSHLFDLYRLDLSQGDAPRPERLEISLSAEDQDSDLFRRRLTEATQAAITSDGLEVAFIAGGDLWVMETVLREPVRVTSTAEFESDPIFVDDHRWLVCVGWKDGQADIMKIARQDERLYWWQNTAFQVTPLTQDAAVESELKLSPDGKQLAYVRDRGELWLLDLESGGTERLVSGFSMSGFDFSPDSRWIVYAQDDNNFNSDIWIRPLDGSSEPVNVSRHPGPEVQPHWSPDGSMIAFTGRRQDRDEVDIYYLYLTKEAHETGPRSRSLKKTLETFQKARQADATATAQGQEPGQQEPPADESPKKADKPTEKNKDKPEPSIPEVTIDFEQIHRRIQRLSIPNSTEQLLGWVPGTQKLVFTATVDGQRGTYSVEFPEELKPKKITSDTGFPLGWLGSPDRLFWLSNNLLATQPIAGGSAEKLPFAALQEIRLSERHLAAFETAWRAMREWWYDENLGNRNWDAIRRKYAEAARQAEDSATLTTVIQLMLGELNGSHLGFTARGDLGRRIESGEDWRPVTGHLGARFDPKFRGPGWKIQDVIEGTPAADQASRLHPGEIILSVDGLAVDPQMDLAEALTGPMDRDIRLRVQAKGKVREEREVVIRPISYGRVRTLLYQKWQDDNRAFVERRAKQQNIGYVHIEGMNWSSFIEFQRELFEVGYGKDGLIIDVRDNGGGSTTDHLLTALTQPRHAVTVPRGGGPGYPSDRMVYATWHKPIVVLCNQNSFSNAEIFSHAIQTLGRGTLVGVPTAGGVISTGSIAIMDVGVLRRPYRGWFVRSTGQDMELNGAVPDVIVWPRPTEVPSGQDRQLNRAIRELERSVKQWQAEGEPELIKATQR